MSNSAFNALLKTLEEPPSFVVFILATTEPQKILQTILSRVQRFDFSKVSQKDLIFNMSRILKNEEIKFEDGALQLISSLSDGGVRDSLSLLDQAVSYSGDTLTIKDVDTLFGLMAIEDEINLISLISERKIDEVIKLVKDKYDKGVDIVRLHNDLIALYKDALIYHATHDSALLEKINVEQVKLIKDDIRNINKRLKILIAAKREYRTADNLFSHFELTLLELMEEQNDVVPVVITKENKVTIKEVNDEKLKTKPVMVTKSTTSNGFKTKKAETEKKEEKITYNSLDILNLMEQADKEERIKVSEKWKNLNNSFSSETAYEVKALAGTKLRLVARGVLVVTSSFVSEINKINTKSAQIVMRNVTRDVFGKSYHILPITENEFMESYLSYKNGKKVDVDEPKIDFGDSENVSNSTQFFEDLMNG